MKYNRMFLLLLLLVSSGALSDPYTARIDDVTISGENVVIEKTEGPTPLPVAASGQAVSFSSLADFKAALDNAEVVVRQYLYLIRIARAYKADPTLGAVFRSNAKAAPHAMMDLTGVASTVTP